MLTDLQLFLGLDPSLGPTQLPEINLRCAPAARHLYAPLRVQSIQASQRHAANGMPQSVQPVCVHSCCIPQPLCHVHLDCCRKVNYKQGWPMKRHEYEHLLSIARPRAEQ